MATFQSRLQFRFSWPFRLRPNLTIIIRLQRLQRILSGSRREIFHRVGHKHAQLRTHRDPFPLVFSESLRIHPQRIIPQGELTRNLNALDLTYRVSRLPFACRAIAQKVNRCGRDRYSNFEGRWVKGVFCPASPSLRSMIQLLGQPLDWSEQRMQTRIL